jgi:hypothetical protein
MTSQEIVKSNSDIHDTLIRLFIYWRSITLVLFISKLESLKYIVCRYYFV